MSAFPTISKEPKKGDERMKKYRADYANEDVFVIILADNVQKALEEAIRYESVYGTLFNLSLLDDATN